MKKILNVSFLGLLAVSLSAFTLTSCDDSRGGRGSEEYQHKGDKNNGQVTQTESGGGAKEEEKVKVVAATSWGEEVATLKGKVVFGGDDIPKNKPVSSLMGTPACATGYPNGAPEGERYLIGKGDSANAAFDAKAIKNVIVYISQGVEAGMKEKKFPTPSEEKIFDQKKCVYIPHVVTVRTGQPLKILNSDPMLHNVNIRANKNRKVNKGTLAGGGFTQKFRKAEPEPILVKCDVHPWMNAYIGVFDHPYFTVTDEYGNWEFPRKLPAGQYAVTFWHEKLEATTKLVTVAAGQAEVQVETAALTE